jgi:hypothetical protein
MSEGTECRCFYAVMNDNCELNEDYSCREDCIVFYEGPPSYDYEVTERGDIVQTEFMDEYLAYHNKEKDDEFKKLQRKYVKSGMSSLDGFIEAVYSEKRE